MEILVLQHIACEPPGVFEDVLVERGATIQRVELDEGEPLPERRDYDAVIAMGGPMSVNDEDAFPWLRDEKRLIAESVRAGTPFWGVCLGVQLLASSLGARVYQGRRARGRAAAGRDHARGTRRPGVRLGSRRAGDAAVARRHVRPARRVQCGSPARPRIQIRLSGSERAYGVQFHLEVTPRDGAGVGDGARVRRVARAHARSRHGPGFPRRDRGACRRDARPRSSPVRAMARPCRGAKARRRARADVVYVTGRISSWISAASTASGIVGVSSRQCGRSPSWTIRRKRNSRIAIASTDTPMIFSFVPP